MKYIIIPTFKIILILLFNFSLTLVFILELLLDFFWHFSIQKVKLITSKYARRFLEIIETIWYINN